MNIWPSFCLILFITMLKIYSTEDVIEHFHKAINQNNVKEVKKLLIKYYNSDIDLANSQDSKKTPAFWRAAHNGYLDLAKLLSKYGADKNTIHPISKYTPLHCCVWNLNKNLYDKNNLTALIKYLNKNNFDMKSPRSFVNKNNVITSTRSILDFAMIYGISLSKYLISRGVSLDEVQLDEHLDRF